jgi:hypothetical protein
VSVIAQKNAQPSCLLFTLRVAEEARLKVQYSVIGEQLKANNAEIMFRLKDAATAAAELQRAPRRC